MKDPFSGGGGAGGPGAARRPPRRGRLVIWVRLQRVLHDSRDRAWPSECQSGAEIRLSEGLPTF